MITIDAERCTGCGACLEVCPTGALYLVDGKATVDGTLCHECEACLATCSTEAIALVRRTEAVEETIHVPALQPEPAIIPVKARSSPLSLRSRVLPVVGTAMAWAGRELLPVLADSLLNALDRWATSPQPNEVTRGSEIRGAEAKGRGRQHRHRQRGSQG